MPHIEDPQVIEGGSAVETPYSPSTPSCYDLRELLAFRLQKESVPSDCSKVEAAEEAGEAPGASEANTPKSNKSQHHAVLESPSKLQHLTGILCFRVETRPQESHRQSDPPPSTTQRSPPYLSPPQGHTSTRALPGHLRGSPGVAKKQRDGTPFTKGLSIQGSPQQPNDEPTDFRPRVNPCPDLQALHAARQRLVSLAREAGPEGLALSQVFQKHCCTYNSLLEPRSLGFDDLGALVRSVWPSLRLRTTPKPDTTTTEQEQQPEKQFQQQPKKKVQAQKPEKTPNTCVGSATASEPGVPSPQDVQQQEQQSSTQQKQELLQVGEDDDAARSACEDEQIQEAQKQKALPKRDNHAGPVVEYVRPLLSLEAHLFSNLLFALIADAAEQHKQQKQQQPQPQKREEAAQKQNGLQGVDETEEETGDESKDFQGVPFAALPRLWQEKYSALADLRHFQVAAGARDLCAFLEELPELTLQRKEGALLLSLVDGVSVPEGPQYIPNELRRPAPAAPPPLLARTSSALLQLPQSAAAAVPLLGPIFEQQQRHAAAGAAAQQHQRPWQASPWPVNGKAEAFSPSSNLQKGRPLALQSAHTLLQQLQQQGSSELHGNASGAAAQKQLHTGVPAQASSGAGFRGSVTQPLPPEGGLEQMLRETLESLGDENIRSRLLKSLALMGTELQQQKPGPTSVDVGRGALGAALQPKPQQQHASTVGVLAELLAAHTFSDKVTDLQRQHLSVQQQTVQSASSGCAQLRRRLLSFVRAACKQQRLQWQRNEDLSEMLVHRQQATESGATENDGSKELQQLLLLLQLDSQMQQQQQRTEGSNSSTFPRIAATLSPGSQNGPAATAAAVRRYLLRLLASPAVEAARIRHRLNTAGATVSAIKREWRHQYGESLSQRLLDAGISFGELVEKEPQIFVLGAERGLRLATRQHLEEFGLLQLTAATSTSTASAQSAAMEVAFPQPVPSVTHAHVGTQKLQLVQHQPQTEQQRHKQLLQLLLQLQQQQQQQMPISHNTVQLQESQHNQQPPQHNQEQVLQLLQTFLAASDGRGAPHRGGSAGAADKPVQDAAMTPGESSAAALRSVASLAKPSVTFKANLHKLVYILVAKLCQQQHAKYMMLRNQCEAPQRQEQQQLLLLQQQGRWKAAQDARTLSENGIMGVRVTELSAEWRRLYGCELEAPMRHAGYPDEISLVSAVPGLLLLGEGVEARCLVALQTASQGQQADLQPVEELQATGKGGSSSALRRLIMQHKTLR